MSDATTAGFATVPVWEPPKFEVATRETGAATLVEDGRRQSATDAEREAILVSLHEERRRLTQAKRLGKASNGDEEYLAELKQYIDEWEAYEVVAAAKDDVWTRLDALASTLLAAQAEIARHQKK